MKSVVTLLFFFCCCCCFFGYSLTAQATSTVKETMDLEWNKLKSLLPVPIDPLKLNPVNQTFCTCGVFLSGQFKKGSSEPPVGHPALMHEQDSMFPCTQIGAKQCSNKCLEMVAKHLPNSPTILCGSIDRDVFRERAYLFIQNCNGTWVNTKLSAGREFCCKDGSPYKCPNNLI
ncbi:follicle cell protein 3C-1 [Sitodiplosis mosellana]|uniref:follicle cell protein 3C-1 n=1 Tax=Sitodiplosis mosellana TaxID=263140 RepID=UPI002443F5EC|nr:follicle cell protein 3C-1 [Sitodiplosis mosellana]